MWSHLFGVWRLASIKTNIIKNKNKLTHDWVETVSVSGVCNCNELAVFSWVRVWSSNNVCWAFISWTGLLQDSLCLGANTVAGLEISWVLAAIWSDIQKLLFNGGGRFWWLWSCKSNGEESSENDNEFHFE